MRIDAVSVYNLFFILVCITLMFSYIVLSRKKLFRKTSTNIRYTKNQVRIYFLKLTSKDYNSYEKYGIWRYITQF